MRIRFLTLLAAVALAPVVGADAADPSNGVAAFSLAQPIEVAQYESREEGEDEEERIRREERELRERKRALKERQREEREAREERDDRRDRHSRRDRQERWADELSPRAWIGVGAGIGAASVDVPCSATSTETRCTEGGVVGTYYGTVTLTGPYSAIRARGIRAQDRGNDAHTPYEEAVMIGSRFGHSNWYGMAGIGRILHADDDNPDTTNGFAWEIVFAPSSSAVTGIEVAFQGNLGPDVDYFGVNVGMRLGLLQ
jgi:hypothetical protein